MSEARRATAADTAELLRLRGVMLASMAGQGQADDGWQSAAYESLRARLGEREPSLVAFVVDRADITGGLAACAVGRVDYRIGGPDDPVGESGYVFSVVTDPDARRRGYSRSCVTALLDWFRERGTTRVDLRASPEAEPLYLSLGFTHTPDPAMRLRLPPVG
ncbi:GNAT family N-acetyltransferase [Streptomyces oceani]|uniref:Acetyltransferase n=1 Tax=Streptomyces oceani TaxID=1075402 RepID=A0A1E7JRQ0_9ACTN|nr:GNAT family N-acetyltransferase [Streptomyces oceani]OEU91450.1 acetyltransferase [Streptomyces oceani]